MIGVNESARFTRQHGAVASRLTGIATSLFFERPVLLADAADPKSSHEGRTIVIERSDSASIALAGKGGHLTYSDPGHETTIAALVAMLCANGGPVAADPVSLAVIALADRLAQTDIPVLIHGPTGTGKEVLSKFIHQRSARADQPFIAVNCAAIPETMLEALLFGHEKGAFTGANATGEGFFRAADGGTLLLDEIAEMPLSLQAKLLRALQEGEVVPIGATSPVKVDVRVIACANRDLPGEVAAGRFREDLFYRLNVYPVDMPSLRERRDDIPALVDHFVNRFNASEGAKVTGVADETMKMLYAFDWPGNVRQLENAVFRAVVLCDGDQLRPQDFPQISGQMPDVSNLPSSPFNKAPDIAEPVQSGENGPVAIQDEAGELRTLSDIERDILQYAIDFYEGHMSEVSRRLGIGRSTLYRKVREYDLDVRQEREAS